MVGFHYFLKNLDHFFFMSRLIVSGQITNLEELKSKSPEELWVLYQGMLGQIFQLSQLVTIKDEEIKQKNLELEICRLQIKDMDDLRSRIVELEYERNELLKRVEAQDNHIEMLESTVQTHETTIQTHETTIQNHETTIQNHETTIQTLQTNVQTHETTIQTLQTALSPLITLQQSLSARQIATEAEIKAIRHIFPRGTSAPYYFKSVSQLDNFLNKGHTSVVSGKAKEAWDAKSSVDKEDVKNKLDAFQTKFQDFTYYTDLLKQANNSSAHAIVGGTKEYYESIGDEEAMDAIDYCNNVKVEVSVWS
jgi:hypothetical protein